MFRNLFIIAFCLTEYALAFTLLSPNPPRFANMPIPVKVIDQNCDNANLAVEELESFLQKAFDRYWNTVSHSSLKLKLSGRIAADNDLSIEDMLSSIGNNEIVVGCSNNPSLFESASILALGTMANLSFARGAVAINDTVGSDFATLSNEKRIATLAHELGHALGIGHSQHSHALMYYSISESISRKRLAEDDADAVAYLYPHRGEWGGLMGACGQIDSKTNSYSMLKEYALLALMFFLLWQLTKKLRALGFKKIF